MLLFAKTQEEIMVTKTERDALWWEMTSGYFPIDANMVGHAFTLTSERSLPAKEQGENGAFVDQLVDECRTTPLKY
jgi:hypothetical protein